MSELTQEQEQEALELAGDPSSQLGAILSFLAPEEGAEAGSEGEPAADGAAAGDGQQPAAGEGAAAAGGDPAGAGDGAGSEPGVADAGGAGAGDDTGAGQPAAGDGAAAGAGAEAQPGVGELDAAELNDKWGEIATGFETNQMEHLRNAALAELQEEHPKYFESLGKHPRLLVGTEVPSLTHPGQNERLRDANDAREWQEAVKNILTEQIQTKAEEKQAELTEVFATVHASIDLFRNNHDLIPGTKQFDPELAREFTTMAKDYELRADGKLIGYSVPVQPLINQLRTRITEQRTKAAAAPAPPAAPAAPSPAQQRVAEQPRNDAGQWAPQAGIPSRAGQSGDGSSDAQEVIDAFIRQNGFHF